MIRKIDDKKIEEKLEKFLKRKPNKDEIINARNDFNIINEIIIEQIDALDARVKKLEQI